MIKKMPAFKMAITVENQNILESDDKKKTTWTIEVIS
jgi:hypothetical protein